MSLIKKKTEKPTEREALSSPREIRAQIEAETKQKTQAIQKKHREKYLADWKTEKSKIDGMSPEELEAYIESSEGNAVDPRVGLHSMKINPHEHAVIKLAMELTGARSSRELFVKHCKEVINNSK
ncbi:hypothetical protein LCX39_004247 [Vibrio vulnificus]|nr:hypothetical protein [Vibrio vulnificus]ELA7318255.1 hypothetical protein [Vibrio alginolyticus]ELC3210316.1 hypothetical protein [Vibrio parahaemolyticus]HCG5971791.1 hypothetical protein [Vibrio parahaemolyticus]